VLADDGVMSFRRRQRGAWVVVVALLVAAVSACGSGRAPSQATVTPGFQATPGLHQVKFQSRGLALTGYLWIPRTESAAHPLRLPAVVWNHGSEQYVPVTLGSALAKFYNNAGFVFFMPIRRGHLPSPGTYRTTLAGLLAEVQDVAAGITYLKSLPVVDRNRIVVSGASNGGIMTLLAADQGLGLRAAISFAPGAESWANTNLRDALVTAAQNVKIPTFIIQAQNDYSLGPVRVLGQIVADNKVLPHQAKLYPAYGTTHQEGHADFATEGFSVWGQDVLTFIRQAFTRS
jgi:poly(3-hydroxybutyrate) depolymerase